MTDFLKVFESKMGIKLHIDWKDNINDTHGHHGYHSGHDNHHSHQSRYSYVPRRQYQHQMCTLFEIFGSKQLL